MFGLGLEFSLHKLAEVGGPGLLSAGIQAAGMEGVGVLLGLALGWGPMNSLFLGVMLAMSSTMITMKNVEDLGMKEEKFAGLAMGTLVIEDLLAIFAMVVLSTIAVSQSISGWALAQRIGLLVLSLALWLILGIYLVPTLMKKLVGLMNDEVLLVFSLGLCFLMALLAQEIGLSTELGAFLAGSLLAGTVHAERVEHLVTPCKHLFGAVFFVSVGFMVQPAMIAQYIGPILLLSGAAIIGKLLFLTLGGLAAGQPLGVCLPAAGGPDPGGGVLLHSGRPGAVPVGDGGLPLPGDCGRVGDHHLHHPLSAAAGRVPSSGGWSGFCPNGAWRRWTGTVRPGDGRRGRKAGTGPGSSRDMAGPLPCTGSWPWGSSSWGPSSCCPCWGTGWRPGGGWRSC